VKKASTDRQHNGRHVDIRPNPPCFHQTPPVDANTTRCNMNSGFTKMPVSTTQTLRDTNYRF